VDYDALEANQALKDSVVDEVKTVLADGAGVTKDDVAVTLSKGSLVVESKIFAGSADFGEASTKLSDLDVQASLAGSVTTAIESVAGIDTVSTGPISLSVTVIMPPTLAPTPAETFAPTPAPNSTGEETTTRDWGREASDSDADGATMGSLSHVVGMATVFAMAVSTFML